MKPIECPVCGKKALKLATGAGRTMKHRLMLVAIPDDFALPECGNCGARPIDWRTAQKLDPILEEAYQAKLSKVISEDLDTLAEVKPLYEWERDLGLSVGYLSKVRSEKAPSAQLVALVRLLANQPTRREELADLWACRSTPRPLELRQTGVPVLSETNLFQTTNGATQSPPRKRVRLEPIESGDLQIPQPRAA